MTRVQSYIFCLLLVLACVLGLGPSSAADASPPNSIDLSLKLDSEQNHRFEYSIESTQTMSAFGQDQTSKAAMSAAIDLVRLPAELSDGEIAVGLTYARLAISIDGGQVPGNFDSRDPVTADQGNFYAQICRPIVGKQFRLIVDQHGTIERVEGLETLAPDGLAGVLFAQLFGPEATKAMFQPLLRVLDDGPTTRSIGEAWQVNHPAVSSLGVPESSVEFRLLEVQPRSETAVLSLSGKPEAELPGDAAVLPNVETRESKLTGRLRWNGQLGILESLESESVTEMVSEAQGISITVNSISTTSVKRVNR